MENKNPIIKITIADMGEMTAELYPDKAPATVENFLKHINLQGLQKGLDYENCTSDKEKYGSCFDKVRYDAFEYLDKSDFLFLILILFFLTHQSSYHPF